MGKGMKRYVTISYVCIWGAWLGFLIAVMSHYFLSLPAIDWFSISFVISKLTYIVLIINTGFVLYYFIKGWFFD